MEVAPRLITFAISHYCEKVRWAMDRVGFSYIEECHLPLLHRLVTTPLGGSSVPVLVTETEILKDSADILKYLDTVAPAHLKLYPASPVLRYEVEALEAQFNCKLGDLIRQWGYFYALQNQSVMKQLWCEGVPVWEKSLFPVLFPLTRYLVHSSYNIHRESALAAYCHIQQIFNRVSDLLSDGRKYLVGDYFSAADIAFASLTAPGLMPPEYGGGGRFPELNQVPDEMVEQILILRETVAGKYALRLYQEERYVQATH
jgi:glutathione S-transferase